MFGPLGRLGAAATLGQHCPQMTQRPGKYASYCTPFHPALPLCGAGLCNGCSLPTRSPFSISVRVHSNMSAVSVSIQDTLYALYTIQHQEPLLKYYKYYIVINFILFPPNCVKKYKILPNNHIKF